MNRLISFLRFFTFITTGILLITAITCEIEDVNFFPSDMLKNILLSGFLTSIVTELFRPYDFVNKGYLPRIIFHFLSLCVIMIFLGSRFGWISPDINGAVFMVISVAAVYVFTFAVTYITGKKDADEINEALKQRNKQ